MDEQAEKLPALPCKCGGETFVVSVPEHWGDNPNRYQVSCASCNAVTAWYWTKAEAIAAWNRRAGDSK